MWKDWWIALPYLYPYQTIYTVSLPNSPLVRSSSFTFHHLTMCINPADEQDYESYSLRMTAHLVESSSVTSFTATRLNKTTFRLVEDDRHIERPMVYVKLYATCIVVIDTGCNSPRNEELPVTSLRRFIETVPLDQNEGMPLNPDGRLPYYILLSHCHYDHIGMFIILTLSLICSGN